MFLCLLECKREQQPAGTRTLGGSIVASLHGKPGLWLQQLHSPVVHLHNGCLFIHYANEMGGKLGKKGR